MSQNNPVVIRLNGIGMEWDNRLVLDNVSLNVRQGDFVAITGPNGGGKTTLLRIILRLLKPTSGSVDYFYPSGRGTDRLPIGYLPQKNSIDSRFPVTVTDVVASGLLGIKGIGKAEQSERISEMIGLVGLTAHARHAIGKLSGGQLQRALLGRALISKPDVLVLDEPLSYVDKHFEHQIYDIMRSLSGKTTILLVSHEMSTIASMANRHLIVDRQLHECTAANHMVHCDCNG